MNEILYRTPQYRIDTGKFELFTYWGNIDSNHDFVDHTFRSPSTSNYTDPKDHERFTGLTNRDKVKVFENDIVKFKSNHQTAIAVIVFTSYRWYMKVISDCNGRTYHKLKGCEVIGHIHKEEKGNE